MRYEHKDEIIMNLKDYNAGRRVVVGGTNAFESKIEELHEVYSQVSEYEQHKVATTILVNTLKSKADEYEAKAKAFEDIYAHFNQLIHGEIEQREFESYAFDITESYSLGKYESGGSDE